MEYLLAFLIGVIILILIANLFSFSLKVIFKLLLNAAMGAIIIFLINFFGSPFGISIDMNWLYSIVVGIFGVFGAIFLLIFG